MTAKLDAEGGRWAEFRDQSHALFLTNAPQSAAVSAAYLTAGAGGSSMHAGFLTGGPVGSMNSHPTSIKGGGASVGLTSSGGNAVLGPGGVPIAPPQPRP